MNELFNIWKQQMCDELTSRYEGYDLTEVMVGIEGKFILKEDDLFVDNNHLNIEFVGDNIRIHFIEDGLPDYEDIGRYSVNIPVGIKTKSGYFSKKKLPVDFKYQNGELLTAEQAIWLLEFTTDAKLNTFDPWYESNLRQNDSVAAWNHIASNNLQDF